MKSIVGLVAIAILLSCTSEPPPVVVPQFIALQTSTGDEVRIPKTGMQRSEEGIALAEKIDENSKELSKWRAQHKSEPTGLVLATLTELQDASIDELGSAYEIASSTSGPLQEGKLSLSSVLVDTAASIMKRPQPAVDRVKTTIETAVDGNPSIYYLSLQKYRRKQMDWQSYSKGQILQIGAYFFRVVKAPDGVVAEEFVLIFDDPTERVIHGRP